MRVRHSFISALLSLVYRFITLCSGTFILIKLVGDMQEKNQTNKKISGAFTYIYVFCIALTGLNSLMMLIIISHDPWFNGDLIWILFVGSRQQLFKWKYQSKVHLRPENLIKEATTKPVHETILCQFTELGLTSWIQNAPHKKYCIPLLSFSSTWYASNEVKFIINSSCYGINRKALKSLYYLLCR